VRDVDSVGESYVRDTRCTSTLRGVATIADLRIFFSMKGSDVTGHARSSVADAHVVTEARAHEPEAGSPRDGVVSV